MKGKYSVPPVPPVLPVGNTEYVRIYWQALLLCWYGHDLRGRQLETTNHTKNIFNIYIPTYIEVRHSHLLNLSLGPFRRLHGAEELLARWRPSGRASSTRPIERRGEQDKTDRQRPDRQRQRGGRERSSGKFSARDSSPQHRRVSGILYTKYVLCVCGKQRNRKVASDDPETGS